MSVPGPSLNSIKSFVLMIFVYRCVERKISSFLSCDRGQGRERWARSRPHELIRWGRIGMIVAAMDHSGALRVFG